MWRQGFPGGSDGKESAYSVETWVGSLDGEDPLEKGMATHSSIVGASLVAQMAKNPLAVQETPFWSLAHEDNLEKGTATPPVFLPGEFNGQRTLVSTDNRVTKNETQLND